MQEIEPKPESKTRINNEYLQKNIIQAIVVIGSRAEPLNQR